MPPRSFMLIAGEASGDRLAAGLVEALRREWLRRLPAGDANLQPLHKGFEPVFFGAGCDAMRKAGIEIVEDMAGHAVIGISAVLRKLLEFVSLLLRIEGVARQRMPDVIICVDFGGFNLAFSAWLRRRLRQRGAFNNWHPKIVQFVSPQVWGSRPGRAYRMERNLDLLISLYPFEKDWFAERTPGLKVVSVGHPLAGNGARLAAIPTGGPPLVLLLPGSRSSELRRHLPLMVQVARRIRAALEVRCALVVPTEALAARARQVCDGEPIDIRCGGLEAVLPETSLAISKTGTIATELALHGIPAVMLYRTSWLTYLVARQVVTVKWLSMPNILAGEELYPEFIQQAATPPAVAGAALELLRDGPRRERLSQRLRETVAPLRAPDAFGEAARAILDLTRGAS